MKKISFVGSAFVLLGVTALLAVGCQKESAATEDQATASGENVTLNSQAAGTGWFAGSVNQDYAAALRNNYISKVNDKNAPLQIAFSAKDLSGFIAKLQTKYKSDTVYVNFGVYGRGAQAPNPKNNGRLTIFFTGNTKNGKKVNGVSANDEGDGNDYLNHGEINPPPPPSGSQPE